MTRHLAFTGTSEIITAPQRRKLRRVLRHYLARNYTVLHHGDCIVADEYAASFWKRIGGQLHCHPPDNDSKRAFVESDWTEAPKPYLDRNTDIAVSGHMLIATPKEMREEQRSGTWSTVRRARKLNRLILLVFPDGSHRFEQPEGSFV